MAERKVFLKAVSPQAVKEVWTERFRTHARRILDEIAPLGGADLMQAYATSAVWREPEGSHRPHQRRPCRHRRLVAGHD